MRYVFEHRDEARRTGVRASAHVLRRYTWQRTADAMRRCLERWRDAGVRTPTAAAGVLS
jgi:hypothetical protein